MKKNKLLPQAPEPTLNELKVELEITDTQRKLMGGIKFKTAEDRLKILALEVRMGEILLQIDKLK